MNYTLQERWDEDAEDIHNLLSFVHDNVKNNKDVHFYETLQDGIRFTGTERISNVCQVFIEYKELEAMWQNHRFHIEGIFQCSECKEMKSEFDRSADDSSCCIKCSPDE